MCPSRGSKGWRISLGTATALGQEVTHVTSSQMGRLKRWGLGSSTFPDARKGEENQMLVNTVMSARESLSHAHWPCSISCLCPILPVSKPLLSLVYWLPWVLWSICWKLGPPVFNVSGVDSAIRSIWSLSLPKFPGGAQVSPVWDTCPLKVNQLWQEERPLYRNRQLLPQPCG